MTKENVYLYFRGRYVRIEGFWDDMDKPSGARVFEYVIEKITPIDPGTSMLWSSSEGELPLEPTLNARDRRAIQEAALAQPLEGTCLPTTYSYLYPPWVNDYMQYVGWTDMEEPVYP